MQITQPDDAGNIQVVEIDGLRADLIVRDDNAAAFRQWFSFVCHDGPGAELRIVNAGQCTYPEGFQGYRVCMNAGAGWVRAPAIYEGGVLSFRNPAQGPGPVAFAYFEPYSRERRNAKRLVWGARATTEALGTSVDGEPVHCLTFGNGTHPIWVIARQHPGESMGEWFAEGLCERLCNGAATDESRTELLSAATVYVVPCMNPDGALRGNHRTNAAGVDLNRSWHDPDPVLAPEVRAVRDRMDKTGMLLSFDIHGDETIPYAFASGGEGTPSWTEAHNAAEAALLIGWAARTPDFQTKHGYPRTPPGRANLTICTNQLAERFSCLSLTIEQPFTDNAAAPDEVAGWSGARSARLGASLVEVLVDAVRGTA